MTATVRIIPYGSLQGAIPLSDERWAEHPLADARCLADILDAIGVPVGKVQLAMINHRAAGIDAAVRAGDRIALFPREYPIFVDWHAHRRAAKT